VLAGDITSIGNSLVVSARLVATGTGDVLWAGRETISDADGLAPAVDRLSATLRERIGESLRSIRADPPLVQMTTRSTEALRLFVQAVRAQDVNDAEGGIALLRQAIERDSAFAMAYRKLGVLLRNTDIDDTAAFMPSFRRAYALRDRLSARERFLAEAAYHGYVMRDTASAIAAYAALLERHPDDRVAGNNLAIVYSAQGRKAEALAVFKNSIRSGSAAATTYANSIDLVLELEGRDSAGAHIERFAAAYPANPRVDFFRGLFHLSLWNVDSAEALFLRLRNATAGNLRAQTDALNGLVGVAMLRGKLVEGEALQRERARVSHQVFPENDLPIPLATHLELEAEDFHGYVLVEFLGDTAGAIALFERGLSRVSLERRDAEPAGPVLNAARLYAHTGRATRARALWRRWESLVADSVRRDPAAYPLAVRGVVHGAEGRLDDAVRDIRLAREKVPGCQVCYLTDLAAIYRRAGAADSAIAVYEQILAAQTLGIDLHVPDLERLAALYEQTGDSVNAAKYYARVADMWKEADAPLQPRVAIARQKPRN
jgi:tetratricopeptide (TPR) repeat protein